MQDLLDQVAAALTVEAQPEGGQIPSPRAVAAVMEGLRAALFPRHFQVGEVALGALGPPGAGVRGLLEAVARTVEGQLAKVLGDARDPRQLARQFLATLPGLKALLETDVEAAFRGDPAARSRDEVLMCYPGVHALIHHRVAHALHHLDVPLLPRLISEASHGATGIDLHPGATIGPSFFIDHGTGVVIGETAIIGQRVRIYQGVTLGARSFPMDADGSLVKGQPRHPIVEDDVVIYAGATVLGRVTIGAGSRIGGNVWLTHDVPPGSRIAQARMRVDGAAEPAG